MLILYSHERGSQKFEVKDLPPLENEDDIFKSTCKLLAVRGLSKSAEILANNPFRIERATNHFQDNFYVLTTHKSTEEYEHWRKLSLPDSEYKEYFEQVFEDIAKVMNEGRYRDELQNDRVYIRFVVCEHDNHLADFEDKNWRKAYVTSQAETNNQAVFNFPESEKLSRYGLNFRSKTEIKIYEELVKRNLW